MNDFPTCTAAADLNDGGLLTCDLSPDHDGDLHWEAMDGVFWKTGEPGEMV